MLTKSQLAVNAQKSILIAFYPCNKQQIRDHFADNRHTYTLLILILEHQLRLKYQSPRDRNQIKQKNIS